MAGQQSTDLHPIKTSYSSLTLIWKIFYSLTFRDWPNKFNMKTCMDNFLALLKTDNALLKSDTDSDTEAGLGEQLRSEKCDIISHNVAMYDVELTTARA